jgi:hypothetical protein
MSGRMAWIRVLSVRDWSGEISMVIAGLKPTLSRENTFPPQDE